MPTHSGPNTKGEENLVFGYDLGDTSNLYKGEPTVNMLYSTGGYNFTNGGSDIYGRATKTNLGGGKYRYVNNGAGVSTIRLYVNQPDLIDGQTYAVSVYFEDLVGSLDIDWCDQTVVGTNSSSNPSGRLGGYSSRSSYASPYYFFDITISTGGSVTLFNPQVEYKSHVTPFVAGTRSATQGLIDLKGNSTIDLSNVSFDSNAQMTFDGTNDYMPVPFSPSIPLYTLETVFYNINTIPNNDSAIGGPTSYQTMFWFNQDAPMGVSLGGWTSSATNEAIHIWSSPSSPYYLTHTRDAVPSGYHHLTFTWNGSYYDIYLNGEKQTVYAGNNGHARLITLSHLTVGGDTSSGYIFNGNIDLVKVYSRGLTASEIKANYNAIKGRFNI